MASRILVVDDNASILEVLTELLTLEGYRVIQAENGRQALDICLQAEVPDAIVLDLNMPVLSGWDFLEARAKDPALAAIPVVVVSAAHTVTNLPNDVAYLKKPFHINALLQAINRL